MSVCVCVPALEHFLEPPVAVLSPFWGCQTLGVSRTAAAAPGPSLGILAEKRRKTEVRKLGVKGRIFQKRGDLGMLDSRKGGDSRDGH